MIRLTDDDFLRLVSFVKINYGINLEKKRILVEGRLSRIILEKGYSDYKGYLDAAFQDVAGQEMVTLVNRLTTNHTFFLREPEHFEFLKSTILPYVEETVSDRDVRIWCAASSTGQEPYTMAMTIDEYFGARKENWDCKILATDISTEVLRKAKTGVYSAEAVKDVPPRWLEKYFVPLEDGRYRVAEKMRNEVVYKQFNLMHEIVYKKPFDLISCRNVMIYFDTETKNRLVERLYGALKPGGYLFIGHAENIQRNTGFDFIRPAIYRKPL